MGKVDRDKRHDLRRRQTKPWRALYRTKAWKALREAVLARDLYLCQRCGVALTKGRDRPTDAVVNHMRRHYGDPELFFAADNCEAACKQCHDALIQGEEARGYSDEVGDDGMPTDHRHPFNRA